MTNPIVDRIRLMMEYDLSKTSTENLSLIQEQPVGLASVLGATSKSVIDDVIRAIPGGVRNTGGKVLKNADDVIRASSRNLLSAATAGQLRMGLLRNPGISKDIQKQLIDDLVSSTQVASRYQGKTAAQIAKTYKTAGYTDDVANEIGRKIAAVNKAGGKVAVTTTTTATKNVKAIPQGNYMGISSYIWNRAGQVIRTMSWLNFLKWGLKLGLSVIVIHYLWKWFTGEDPKDEDGNVVPQPKPESKYRDCEGQEVITMGCKSSDVRRLQGCIGVEADGAWGPKTQSRMVELGLGQGLSVSDIDQICKTQDDVEQEAEQNANDKLNPKVRGSETEFDVSSNSSNTNIDLTLSTGSVDDFS
jgi:hypothetical protein